MTICEICGRYKIGVNCSCPASQQQEAEPEQYTEDVDLLTSRKVYRKVIKPEGWIR